jgi:DNA-binding NarL/FixJ family response regulator
LRFIFWSFPKGQTPIHPGSIQGGNVRQIEVLALMMQGKSNKELCRILELAEPTVKNHVAAILKALKVKNRTEAVIAVIEHGWKLRPIKK